MLGFKVSQATVSRYLWASGRGPGQSWRTFIRNQAMAFGRNRDSDQNLEIEDLVPSNMNSTFTRSGTLTVSERFASLHCSASFCQN